MLTRKMRDLWNLRVGEALVPQGENRGTGGANLNGVGSFYHKFCFLVLILGGRVVKYACCSLLFILFIHPCTEIPGPTFSKEYRMNRPGEAFLV